MSPTRTLARLRVAAVALAVAVPALAIPAFGSATAAASTACTVTVTPSSNFRAAVNSGANGSVVCFAAGVYRVTAPLAPRQGQTLRGEPGAVLSGAVAVDSWAASGARYVAHGYLPAAYSDGGVCESTTSNDCRLAETLRVNGRLLSRASSAATVTASSYYADYDTNDIYLGVAPAPGQAELSRTRIGIQSSSSDVVVEGFTIEGFASLYQRGAVMVCGPRWTVQNNVVRWNHNVGIQLALSDDARILSNTIDSNGETGVSQWKSTGVVISGNTISNNNTDGYWIADGQSGGIKFAESTALFSKNVVAANKGVGVWADSYTYGITIDQNVIRDNDADGVRFEISKNGVISDNQISDNALHLGRTSGTSLYSGGGVNISNASQVSISGNSISGNLNGIALQDRNRKAAPSGESYHLADVSVTANTVDMHDGGATGVVQNSGITDIVTANNLRFNANRYLLASTVDKRFYQVGGALTFAQWQSTQDSTGSVRRYSEATPTPTPSTTAPTPTPTPDPSTTPPTPTPTPDPSTTPPTPDPTSTTPTPDPSTTTPPTSVPTTTPPTSVPTTTPPTSVPTTTPPTSVPTPKPTLPTISLTGGKVTDTFARRVSKGWGSTHGHAWTNKAQQLRASGNRGVAALSRGVWLDNTLQGIRKTNVTLTSRHRVLGTIGGTGTYLSLDARVIAKNVQYQGTVRVLPNGKISAIIYRLNHGAARIIGTEVFLGTRFSTGSPIAASFSVKGTYPTALSMTVVHGSGAGSAVRVTAKDSTPALQHSGGVGVTQGLSSRARASEKVQVRYDRFIVAY
ncbi:parallel beta-helix repeat (two copies) [Jatrophihabitans endophyticus]|uniref:Parallel beta-helix repeat (Two copies) n=1 Tax=Jatrophihabitans endophyticus TaxID=1206085 RepID=A0A1M5U847_9ACTN|nr:right-handed parallel beta-helix repeat-containing protein [Jatrophihabitans endophyticus]SHH59144.1 parallel beta-helix repeat (two copies) [Jatrophihabitans endophyticus]